MPDTPQHADLDARSKRLRFTFTRTMLVDVDPEEAARLLAKEVDYLDVIDAATRYQRVAAHDYEYIESDLSVEDATDDWASPYGVTPVNGDGREKYLWSARHFVIEARRELSSGRYREGICPELDAVNRDLAVIEDRLRLMALAADPQHNNPPPHPAQSATGDGAGEAIADGGVQVTQAGECGGSPAAESWWRRFQLYLWRQGFKVPASWWPDLPHIDGPGGSGGVTAPGDDSDADLPGKGAPRSAGLQLNDGDAREG